MFSCLFALGVVVCFQSGPNLSQVLSPLPRNSTVRPGTLVETLNPKPKPLPTAPPPLPRKEVAEAIREMPNEMTQQVGFRVEWFRVRGLGV